MSNYRISWEFTNSDGNLVLGQGSLISWDLANMWTEYYSQPKNNPLRIKYKINYEKYCYACETDQPNQLAHYGGCIDDPFEQFI